MTKRACPFEINIPRQLKFHINDYENDLNAFKVIQEQTIKKLVDGSKKLNLTEISTGDQMGSISPNGTFGTNNKNLMQKCVTNYFTVNGKIINNSGNKLMKSPEVLNRCFFCEKGIDSTFKCVRCLELYCASCSFINYESLEDSRICISCS